MPTNLLAVVNVPMLSPAQLDLVLSRDVVTHFTQTWHRAGERNTLCRTSSQRSGSIKPMSLMFTALSFNPWVWLEIFHPQPMLYTLGVMLAGPFIRG